MANQYPNSGTLFNAKNRIHPKSPDMNGDIKLDKALLMQLMEEQPGNEIVIKLSAWKQVGQVAGEFISMKVNTFKPEAQATAPQAAPMQQRQLETLPVDDSDIPF